MAKKLQYIDEHKVEVARFVKHIVPWLTIIASVLAVLVSGGWLDTPAKSKNVHVIAERVEINANRIRDIEEILRGVSVDSAVTAQKLLSIEKQIGSIDSKLEKILQRIIARSDNRK